MSEIIEHTGKVVAVNGQTVRVIIMQASACSGCHAKGNCMAAETKEKYIDCLMTEPMQAGDEVMVEVSQRLAWEAVLLSFVVPFVLLMLILWVTGMYFSESIAGTAAILGVMLYYAILAIFKKKMKTKFQFIARKI